MLMIWVAASSIWTLWLLLLAAMCLLTTTLAMELPMDSLRSWAATHPSTPHMHTSGNEWMEAGSLLTATPLVLGPLWIWDPEHLILVDLFSDHLFVPGRMLFLVRLLQRLGIASISSGHMKKSLC
jgi:hypothetical protein